MTTAIPSWAQARMTKARESLPRVQVKLDAARGHLDDLQIQQGAVERAVAILDSDADPDIALAVQVASDLLPPLVAAAETAVAGAMAERRAARADLLPPEDHPWAKINAARQADRHAQGKWDTARSQLGALQRGRAMALGVMREAGPASNMAQLAAAEAELRIADRALPAARAAVAAAEAVAQEARSAVEAMEARGRVLRVTVLTGEPEQAEAALVELQGLVGEERSGLLLR